jgi:hypothetical protein
MKTPLRSSSNAGAQQAPARTLEVRQRFAAHMHVLAVAAVAASAFRAPQALRPACPRLPEAHVLQQQLYATLPPALLLQRTTPLQVLLATHLHAVCMCVIMFNCVDVFCSVQEEEAKLKPGSIKAIAFQVRQ